MLYTKCVNLQPNFGDDFHVNDDFNKKFFSKAKKINKKVSGLEIKNSRIESFGFIVYESKKTAKSIGCNTVNHNSCNTFKDGSKITCRHISHAFLEGEIGTNDNPYEKIKKESDFKELFNNIGNVYDYDIKESVAHKNYICSFDNLGKVFKDIAQNILEHNVPKEFFFIFSENHVMALRFINKNGVIKIDFYDPNDTCHHKNIIFKDVDSMTNIRIEHLLDQEWISLYFPSMLTIYMQSLDRSSQDKKPELHVLFTQDAHEDSINSSIVYFTLKNGIFHLIAEPNKLNLDQETKRADDTPGFFIALQDDHKETVIAFTQLILSSALPNEDKLKLLRAERVNSTPGLFMALTENHKETVGAFISLILSSTLPDKNKLKLLRAERVDDGVPGFFMALQKNHKETVVVFSQLILSSALPDEDKLKLLRAERVDDGTPGFFMALHNGHKETVSAFTNLILSSALPNKDKLKLLQAKTAEGTFGFFMALQEGHMGTVLTFVQLIFLSELPNWDKLMMWL